MNRFQHIAAGAGEFGVESQHLYREVDFVDYALAGRLTLGPQFEVAWRIVQAIAVFVMNIFTFVKRPIKHFGHDDTMLELFSSAAEMQAPVSGRMNMPFRIDWAPAASFVSAFFRTKSLAVIIICTT